MNKNLKKSPTLWLTSAVTIAGVSLLTFGSGQMKSGGHFGYPQVNHREDVKKAIAQLVHMNSAQAANMSTQSLLNALRFGMGMTVGYSDRAAYVALVCDGTDPGAGISCDGPPQTGIVGTLTAILNDLPTIAASAGISQCSAVPSSGSVTGTDSGGNAITLNFSTPTHHIPLDWVGGGAAYEHRVAFSDTIANIGPTPTTIGVAYEFNCGDSGGSYTAVSMDIDDIHQGGQNVGITYYRDIAIFNGALSDGSKGIEVYMAEHNAASWDTRALDGYRIQYKDDGSLSLWGIAQAGVDDGGACGGMGQPVCASGGIITRFNIAGNYTTGKAKMYLHGYYYQASVGDSLNRVVLPGATPGYFADYLAPVADPGDHDVTTDLMSSVAGLAPSGTTEVEKLACVNFGAATGVAPTDADCTGFTLADPPAPGLAPLGHFSFAWAYDQTALGLVGKLEHTTY